jgi:hypothetical protein
MLSVPTVAEEGAPYIGTWRLDVTRSTSFAEPGPRSRVVTIPQGMDETISVKAACHLETEWVVRKAVKIILSGRTTYGRDGRTRKNVSRRTDAEASATRARARRTTTSARTGRNRLRNRRGQVRAA